MAVELIRVNHRVESVHADGVYCGQVRYLPDVRFLEPGACDATSGGWRATSAGGATREPFAHKDEAVAWAVDATRGER